MKTRHYLFTTMLYTLVTMTGASALAAENITTRTVSTAKNTLSNAEASDPRVAALSFVEHVNFARVALAIKNSTLANQHIMQAQNLITVIKSATLEQRRVTQVESGRIVYQYDTEYKYHYFPIQTGPVQVKTISNGPIWAKNDLAVTDADIVYLSLDLTGDKAENYLRDAESAIAEKNLKLADDQLAQLTDAVVTVDSKVAQPNLVAHDNIALARNFIAGKNYDGAKFALNHADDALDDMSKDEKNKSRLSEIAAMRADVKNLQDYIAKKDPTLIQQANTKIDTWWKELKNWSKSSK